MADRLVCGYTICYLHFGFTAHVSCNETTQVQNNHAFNYFRFDIGTVVYCGGMLTKNIGYSLVLTGQAVEGFTNSVGSSIIPEVAAIWFPPDEVAIAVAAQFLTRGLGEAEDASFYRILPTLGLQMIR